MIITLGTNRFSDSLEDLPKEKKIKCGKIYYIDTSTSLCFFFSLYNTPPYVHFFCAFDNGRSFGMHPLRCLAYVT